MASPPGAWPPRHDGGSPSDSRASPPPRRVGDHAGTDPSDSSVPPSEEEYAAGLQRSLQQHGSMQERAAARALSSESAQLSDRAAARPPSGSESAAGIGPPPKAQPAPASVSPATRQGGPSGLALSKPPPPLQASQLSQPPLRPQPLQPTMQDRQVADSPAPSFSQASAYTTSSSSPSRVAAQPPLQPTLNAARPFSSSSSAAGPPRRITQVPEDIFVVDSAEKAARAAKVCLNIRGAGYLLRRFLPFK